MAKGPKVSKHPRTKDDWYVEPPEAADALFRAEQFRGEIYDPACGCGTILRSARAAGYEAHGSDLVVREGGDLQKPWDYLKLGAAVIRPANIVSNPPFALASDFLRQALITTQRKVAFLLRLAFLESEGRDWVFDQTPLARIHVFSWRVSMPPGGMNIKAEAGKVAYAWFVWDREHSGPPTVHRLKRPRAA